MRVAWVLWAVSLQGIAGELQRGIALDLQHHPSDAVIPRLDFIGIFAQVVEQFVEANARSQPLPTAEKCTPRLLKYGEFEVKIAEGPRGSCSYCCPITNPSRFVRLYLANKSSNTVKLKMGRKPGAVRGAGLNSSHPTVFFIHGFTEFGLGPGPRVIRDAYLSKDEDYNVILVDWGDLSTFPWYPQAVQNTRTVAAVVARFIRFYHQTGELPISTIHIIGFSLGAHVAGFIGKMLKDTQKVPRITGLDPALPLYPLHDESSRLCKDDAEYVDVIHTDGGKFGFPISLGDADFYPNGGTFYQPGCQFSSLAESKTIEQLGMCGHLRAWRLYAESVRNPEAFPATKCGIMSDGHLNECRFVTNAYMGFASNKSTTMGNFYLTTYDHKPYSKSAEDQEKDMKQINLVL